MSLSAREAQKRRRWAFVTLAVAAITTAARSARADDLPGLSPPNAGSVQSEPFQLDLHLFAQVEVGAFVAVTDLSDFGGAGCKITLDIGGVGGAVGGRWERDPRGSGALGLVEAQLRPFALARWDFYRWVDPFVAIGSELGGGNRGFRATGTGGAGVDVALWPSESHPALSAQYSFRALQTQPAFAERVVYLGLSMRSVF